MPCLWAPGPVEQPVSLHRWLVETEPLPVGHLTPAAGSSGFAGKIKLYVRDTVIIYMVLTLSEINLTLRFSVTPKVNTGFNHFAY